MAEGEGGTPKRRPITEKHENLDDVAPKQITIYALFDPVTKQLRYIGQTKNRLSVRLRGHMRDRHCNARTDWIQGLKEMGQAPIIREVEVVKCKPGERPAMIWVHANEREEYWIRHMRKCGNNLLNSRRAVPHSPSGSAPIVRGRKTFSRLGKKPTVRRRSPRQRQAR